MTNPSGASTPFQPIGGSAGRTLLAELFAATPLGILVAALKAALQQRDKR